MCAPKTCHSWQELGVSWSREYEAMDKLGINYNVIKLNGKHAACNGKRDFIYEHLLNSNKLE
jgi:hypothetical protein